MQTIRLIFLFVIFSLSVRAQQPFSRDYTLSESATPTKVNAIVQDDIGNIWLGTDLGLYFFNGQVIRKLTDTINGKDSSCKAVTALTSAHGRVVVGYSNGKLAEIINYEAVELHIRNARPTSSITSICLEASGIMFVCTEEEGIFFVMNNIGLNLNSSKGLPDNFVYKVSVLSDERILLGSDNGIADIEWQHNKVNIQSFTSTQGLPDNIVRVIKPIPNTPWYWLGTQEKGLALYNKDSKKIGIPEMNAAWTWGQVNDIVSISAHHTIVITENGYLLNIDLGDSMHAVVKTNLFPNKKLQKLLLDKAGNLWAATDQGLTLISSEYISYFELDAPYALRKVTAIACDKNNILWFAQNNELYRILLSEPGKLPVHTYTAEATITSLYVDKENRLWIGTFGKGLWYRTSDGAVIRAIGPEVLKNESILNINGTENNLWLAGLNGLEELSYPTASDKQIRPIKHHNKSSGIGTDYVYELYPDREGNIWMATDGAGVCKYDGSNYYHWDFFNKLKSEVAYTVTEDKFGDIWLGAKDLYRLHNYQWENMRAAEIAGNLDINISAVIGNGSGQVISVYQRSMEVWYPKSHSFRHFNRKLGLGIDSTPLVLNCVTRDTSGNVYVPFEKGIIIFNKQDSLYDIRPSVDITNSSVYLKNATSQRHVFPYDENDISFHFKGINFTNPDPLNYRYMLMGYKERWINTNDESVTFPRLPPGAYTFIVQASLNNDFVNANQDAYTFVIATPYWRKAWFIASIVILLIGLTYIIIRQREKRLKNMSKLQEERMVFEYEHLKSQVNPHFLFNSLNTLTNLIEENKDTAAEYTVKLADLYRNMLAYRDMDLIFLSEEWEILNDYFYIQKCRFGDALILQADIPEKLMHSKKVIPLALQLLVENAIKHNIVSNSYPLTISISANDYEIRVSNPIKSKMSKEKSEGIGLKNINNRYKLLTKKRIKFGVEGNEFIVILPLL